MLRAALVTLALALAPSLAQANLLLVCRTVDIAASPQPLTVPARTVFRDGGRLDDPIAAFGGDRIPLRVETIVALVIPGLSECGTVPARISGDSAVRSVNANDARRLVYAGSADLLTERVPSEALFSLRARVLDQIP